MVGLNAIVRVDPRTAEVQRSWRRGPAGPSSSIPVPQRCNLVEHEPEIGDRVDPRTAEVQHFPLPPDHPLWGMENVVITPLVARASSLRPERAVNLFGENLRRYCAGEPLQAVIDKRKSY